MDAAVMKVVKGLNKKLGEGTVVLAGDIDHNLLPRFPSGSLALDLILGGGWPGNQWNELVGSSSHGKTAVCLKTIAANQQRDPEFTTVWIAAEEWVPDHAVMCGVDLDRVLIVETNVSEHAFESVIQFAETKAIDCIVIDSLPALIPLPEDEKDMEQLTVGRQAMLTNKFFRKVGKAMKRSLLEEERPLLGLAINQWREKIGVMMGDPRTTPGGAGKDYAYFTRVEVKRDAWIEAGSSSDKIKVGQGIRLRTIKNKSAPPMQTAYIDFYFREGGDCSPGSYDFAKELVSLAALHGVLDRAGAWYSYGDRKWQGGDAVLTDVRAEPDLYAALDKDVRSIG